MRVINENYETVDERDVDLSRGYFIVTTVIRKDATPIDNITKHAWYDDDYEDVRMWIEYSDDDLDDMAQVEEQKKKEESQDTFQKNVDERLTNAETSTTELLSVLVDIVAEV